MRYIDVCSGIEAETCSRCTETKPVDAFHRQGRRGRHSWCKDCFNANARETRNRNVTREQRLKNNLWTKYRLRPEDVAQMLVKQDGKCAICDAALDRLVIDHDHATGAVRGLLCHGCNILLPGAERVEWLKRALAYLGRDA